MWSKINILVLNFLHRGVEQLVARRAHNPKVVGSSPTPATNQIPEFKDSGFLISFLTFKIYGINCEKD